METLGWYLLKSAVWLTGFALVFLVALRNERYFRLNRIFLLSGIIASIVFPLYTWHYAVVLPPVPSVEISIPEISAPVVVPVQETATLPVYWWFYLVGVICFAFRLIWQTGRVVHKLKKTGYEANGSVKLVRTSEYTASFSFFSFVFVNPSTSELETNEIVNHEREHIEQRHWFDLLLAELLCLLQWFNPFVWIYARLIRQNHEYLADEMALQHTDNPAVYQATLLNQMFGGPVISLANSFSYSLNKKRFKMMKKSIDSPFRKLKLLVVLPLIAMVFYAFAKPEYVTSPSDVSADMVTSVAEAYSAPVVSLALPVDKPVKTAQVKKDKIVKGLVVSSDGKLLSGTTVVIKGSTTGTITDKEGHFELKTASDDCELVFSYVGLKTVVAKPDFKNMMTIRMDAETVGIDNVVVVGYGTRKTSLYVVDGTIVSENIFKAINPQTIQSVNILGGESATAKYGDKAANGATEVTLKEGARGWISPDHDLSVKSKTVNSYMTDSKNNPPLILLDGVVIDKTQMAAVSPDKIESISVLKDKSATALYGEKGKDGVILITSKEKAASKSPTQRETHPADKATKNSNTFLIVEQMPQFPGGARELMRFIKNNLRYPTMAVELNVQGKVLVNFIVSRTGKIENAKVIESVYPAIDAEALRVVNSMPDWQPGKQNGEAVDVSYVIPFEFKLQIPDEKSKGIVTGPIPTKISPEEDVAFVIVEQMPRFPGGEEAMKLFIKDQLKYPAVAKELGVQGTVIINFVVNKEGKITRLKVVRGIGAGCDEEALRIMGVMPDWKPGMQGGKPVNVSYTVPIKFAVK